MIASLGSAESKAAGTSASLAAGIETCNAAEGLAAINKPDMELVIWRRALPLCLQTWLERMDASCLPDMRVLVQASDL